MTILKRTISALLALVMVVTMLPTPAAKAVQTDLDTGEVSIQGINGFGNLLSRDIREQYEEDTESSGAYSITDLTIAGSTAVVEYAAQEEALLMVALYSEDGRQLMTSGKATVSHDATEATVTIEDWPPEYFLAEAFLVDPYDYSPLCESYQTPLYTQAMQELIHSDVDDYDPELVWNLDDDKETNFAVYNQDTIVVEAQSGVNTVISANDDTMTYVIGNADEQFLNLQPGDVVSYPYGEDNFLFIKVSSVSVDGSTVNIQGGELELTDIFSHVKIEGDGESGDIIVDENSGDKEVTYLGTGDAAPAAYSMRDIDTGGSASTSLNFEVKTHEGGSIDDPSDVFAGIAGNVGLKLGAEFKLYCVEEFTYLKLKVDFGVAVTVSIGGSISKSFNFAKLELPIGKAGPVGAIVNLIARIKFLPTFVFEADAKLETELSLRGAIGFVYDSGTGIQNLSNIGKPEARAEIKGSLFVGFDLNPRLEVLHEKVCVAQMTAPVGVEFDGKLNETEDPRLSDGTRHDCKQCVDIDVNIKASASTKLQFVKWSYTYTIFEARWKVGNMYYSIDHSKLGWGRCPYLEHKVTIVVVDQNDMPQIGASVYADREVVGLTNSLGAVETWVTPDVHSFSCGKASQSTDIQYPCLITLVQRTKDAPDEDTSVPGIFGDVDSEIVQSFGTPKYSGLLGDDLTWVYLSGDSYSAIIISGNGSFTKEMWDSAVSYPYRKWHWSPGYMETKKLSELRASTVIMEEGITNCGQTFGHDHWNYDLKEISIPSTMTEIEDKAFQYCSGLEKINLNGITSIGNRAFECCTNLKRVNFSSCLDSIGEYAFCYCDSLEEIFIPKTVTSIGDDAFFRCSGLKLVAFEEGFTNIDGLSVFGECTSLETVVLPSTITGSSWDFSKGIGEYTFDGCTSLKTIKLPPNITEIPNGCFRNCGIIEIRIPQNVTHIGSDSFAGCTLLSRIELPVDFYYLGYSAFKDCSSLSEVVFEGFDLGDNSSHYVSIGNFAFENCISLTNIEFPAALNIYTGSFAGCQNLQRIVFERDFPEIYDSTDWHEAVIYAEVFPSKSGTAYYPWKLSEDFCGDKENIPEHYWSKNKMKQLGSNITWIPYTVDEEGNMIPDESKAYCPNKDDAPTDTEPVEATIAETAPVQLIPPETIPVETVPETTVPTEAAVIPETTAEIIPETTLVGDGVPDVPPAPEAETAEETALSPDESEPSLFAGLLDLFALKANAQEIETTPVAETSVMETIPAPQPPVILEVEEEAPVTYGIYGGEYGEEAMESYTLSTASFSGLVPGGEYLLLSMSSIEKADPLDAYNLLAIDQGTAESDGTLKFQYIQRTDCDISYVVACGPSNRDLSKAEITFPELSANGQLHAAVPVVKYDGKTLTEGKDYLLLGQVSFTEPGTYTCFVRGIYNYTGLVECTYTVTNGTPSHEFKLGDVNHDTKINAKDATLILQKSVGVLKETAKFCETCAEVSGDGKLNAKDSTLILQFSVGLRQDFPAQK